MMRKDNSKMYFPLNWRHNYKLQGGIIHMGGLNGGHYIYFGFNKKISKWFIANDSNISFINNIDIFMEQTGSHAYILNYIKLETS